MKARSIVLVGSALGAFTGPLHATPRSSANYGVITDVVDGGGRRTSSASYTNDGSIGGIAGISSVVAPAETAKHGYISQLFDFANGISLAATPATIDEGGTRQISAARNLDDGSGLALDPASVAWSVLSGPISGISLTGVATADTVYHNTGASVQGVANGFTASLALTVLDVNSDNYHEYAGDSLDDAWQVQYFGLPPNIAAGPLGDPDGDGQNNRFEFIAGVDPIDPTSLFKLRIEILAGNPPMKRLVCSPRFNDRTYTPQFRASLATGPDWSELTGAIQTDAGLERSVTHSPQEPVKFYRVAIAKP